MIPIPLGSDPASKIQMIEPLIAGMVTVCLIVCGCALAVAVVNYMIQIVKHRGNGKEQESCE